VCSYLLQPVVPEPPKPKSAYDFPIVPPGPFVKPANPRKRKNTSDYERKREAQREAEALAATAIADAPAAHAVAQATIATTSIPTAADGAAARVVEVPAVPAALAAIVDDDSNDAEEEEVLETEDDDDDEEDDDDDDSDDGDADVDLLAASKAANEFTVNLLNVQGTKVVAGEAHFIKLDKGAPNVFNSNSHIASTLLYLSNIFCL
jgi:hypothetical protein